MIQKIKENKGNDSKDDSLVMLLNKTSAWGTVGIWMLSILVCIGGIIINVANKTPNIVSTIVLLVIAFIIFIYGFIYYTRIEKVYNTILNKVELKMGDTDVLK